MSFSDRPLIDKSSVNADESATAFRKIVNQRRGFLPREDVPDKGCDFDVELINDDDQATAFVKRYVGLHGKTKTYDQILSLTHGLQKSMTELRISASDPASREIEKIQSELIALVTKMGESAKIEIPEPYLSHYKQVAQGKEVRASVRLLKQFIQLNGKKLEKAKALRLGAKLLKAFDEVANEDAYRTELSAASAAISRYVEGETASVDIPAATLHRLGAFAIGSALSGLGHSGDRVLCNCCRRKPGPSILPQ